MQARIRGMEDRSGEALIFPVFWALFIVPFHARAIIQVAGRVQRTYRSEGRTGITPGEFLERLLHSSDRLFGIRQGHEPEQLHESIGLRAAVARMILLAVLICLVVIGIARVGEEMQQGVAFDFYQFWAIAGADELLPGENVYSLSTGERLGRILLALADGTKSPAQRAAALARAHRVDAVSTPFLYACFRAFRTGNYDTDLQRYRLCSLAAFILATLLVGHLVGCAPAVTLAALAFFLWLFPPLKFDLTEGNVNAIQLGMLALIFWLRRNPDCTWRTLATGFILALAVLFKPNLAIVAVLLALGWVFLGRGRDAVRAGLGAAVGIAIGFGLSAWFLGATASWANWLYNLRHLERDFAVGIAQGNLGGAKLLGDILGWDPTVFLLIMLVGIVGSELWMLRRTIGAPSAAVPLVRDVDDILIALSPAVAILGTAIAWPHYTILCVPLCLICLQQVGDRAQLVRVSGLLALAALVGLSSTAWLGVAGLGVSLAQALAVLALYIAGVLALHRHARATDK